MSKPEYRRAGGGHDADVRCQWLSLMDDMGGDMGGGVVASSPM